MLRPLGNFERALYLSDRYAPFNIIAVLELESPPPPAEFRRALAALQARHPFLRVRVESRRGRPHFVENGGRPVPFTLLERASANWLETVEDELHRRMDSAGPLARCIYLRGDSRAELILALQHTIVDAASAARLLHELLTIASAPLASFPALQPAPAVETRFPSSGRLRYAASQLADEVRYRLASRGRRQPLLRFGGKPRVLTMTLDAALTDSLSRRARTENATLNSLLQAALLLAVNRHLYHGQRTPMRTFAFPDLRAYVTPPLGVENLGAYISMLRYTFAVEGNQSVWDLARDVSDTFQVSFKRGDKFAASLMSEAVMKMFLGLKSMRMGAAALSYTGNSDVAPQYGQAKVHAMHGFIANMDIGPEFSAQVSLFNEGLIWDMVYLDHDMDRPKAERIAAEIKKILEEAI